MRLHTLNGNQVTKDKIVGLLVGNRNSPSKHMDWSYFRDLVLQKTWSGLKAEASRGYLGVLWWVLEPIMYMAVFYVVFVHLFKRGDESYISFLLVGLTVWKLFNATVNTGANSLIANLGLMNQVYVPKIVFPLTVAAINTFKFLIILSLLILFLLFTSAQPSMAWLLLPIIIGTQIFLIIAVASFFSSIMPFFPDLKLILDNVLMMLFFLSGIFFDMTKMSPDTQQILMLNPMAVVIVMYRNLLLKGLPPQWHHILYVIFFSSISFLLALRILGRFDQVYPKIIH